MAVVADGGGVELYRDHILQEFYSMFFWPDSEPTKLLHHPKQKWPVKTTLRGLATAAVLKVPHFWAVNYFTVCNLINQALSWRTWKGGGDLRLKGTGVRICKWGKKFDMSCTTYVLGQCEYNSFYFIYRIALVLMWIRIQHFRSSRVLMTKKLKD